MMSGLLIVLRFCWTSWALVSSHRPFLPCGKWPLFGISWWFAKLRCSLAEQGQMRKMQGIRPPGWWSRGQSMDGNDPNAWELLACMWAFNANGWNIYANGHVRVAWILVLLAASNSLRRQTWICLKWAYIWIDWVEKDHVYVFCIYI